MVLLLLGGFALSVLAVFHTTVNRPSRADALPPGTWWRRRREQGAFLRYSLLPTVLAALCLSTFWAWYSRDIWHPPDSTWIPLALPLAREVSGLVAWQPPYGFALLLIMIGVGVYVLALALAFGLVLRRLPYASDLSAAFFTGSGAGVLTWLLLISVFAKPTSTPLTAALYGCLAVPAYLLVIFSAIAIFVAVTSKRRAQDWQHEADRKRRFAIEDEDREWLGRHGGWLFIMALAWMACSGLVVFGPALLVASPKLLAACGGVSGLVAILGGKSALTAGSPGRAPAGWKTLVVGNSLAIASMLFLAIMVAALSLVTQLGNREVDDALVAEGVGLASLGRRGRASHAIRKNPRVLDDR